MPCVLCGGIAVLDYIFRVVRLSAKNFSSENLLTSVDSTFSMKATDIMAKPYRLLATAETVHWGYLDSKLPPVLRIKSGDRVIIETISGTPQIVTGADAGFEILPDYELVFARHQRVMGPHILTGPIFIEGAVRAFGGSELGVGWADRQSSDGSLMVLAHNAAALRRDTLSRARLEAWLSRRRLEQRYGGLSRSDSSVPAASKQNDSDPLPASAFL
jgi:hypothetical protein